MLTNNEKILISRFPKGRKNYARLSKVVGIEKNRLWRIFNICHMTFDEAIKLYKYLGYEIIISEVEKWR